MPSLAPARTRAKPFHATHLALSLLAALAFFTPSLHAQAPPKSAAPPAPATRPTAQDPATALRAQAQDALDRKDYAAAIDLLQKIAAQAPADALPHFELGYAYSELAENEQAAAEYRRAIALNNSLAPAHLNLGLVLMRHRSRQAAAEFQRAAALTPDDGRPHMLAGKAFETANKLPEAITEYQAAAPLLPKDASPRLALGAALLRADRAAESEAAFREALTLGGSPQAWSGLAQALLRQDKNQEAIGAFTTYLKTNPEDREARFDHAVALQNLNRFDDSLAELDLLDQSGAPTAAALKLRASIYIQQMKWMEAANTLEKAISGPAPGAQSDAQLYAWLGRARLNLRDFPAAETALRHSLTLDPTPVETLRDLSNTFYFSKQCQPALDALDLLAQRGTPTALDWFLRATCYDRLERKQEAAAAYQKFLDLDGNAHPDQVFEATNRRKLLLRELENKR